jgi:hypothetical protein
MKKLIFYGCLMTGMVMLATSCKDDDAPAPQLLLTSVSRDGLPVIELTYDSEGNLRQTDLYADGDLVSYVLYDYDGQEITEVHRYDEDHDLVIRTKLTLDNAGRIIKSEDYTAFTDFKSVSATTTFTYDAAGMLKSVSYGTLYDPELSREEYTYDGSNRLIKRDVTKFPNQPEEHTSDQIDFTPHKTLYPHWARYVFLLSLSNADVYLEEIFNSNTHQKSWDDDGEVESEYTTEATDKQFNSDGYLIRQFLTRTSLHANEPDEVREMTYGYTE